MITINNLTVRLWRASVPRLAAAATPLNSRIELIGRNGAGRSTLTKVLIGELDPDQGLVEIPRLARVAYIAQEAPSGSIIPLNAVLAGDVGKTERPLAGPDRPHRRSARQPSLIGQSVGELTRESAVQSAQLEDVESGWLEANESLEKVGA